MLFLYFCTVSGYDINEANFSRLFSTSLNWFLGWTLYGNIYFLFLKLLCSVFNNTQPYVVKFTRESFEVFFCFKQKIICHKSNIENTIQNFKEMYFLKEQERFALMFFNFKISLTFFVILKVLKYDILWCIFFKGCIFD